jgi:hypothetical protein
MKGVTERKNGVKEMSSCGGEGGRKQERRTAVRTSKKHRK